MSNDQLDVALAKLMNPGGGSGGASKKVTKEETTPSKQGTDVSARCAMCGKGFADPSKLGEHIILCTGFNEDDGGDVIVDASNEQGDDTKTTAFSSPGMFKFLNGSDEDDNALNDGDFEDYEDYDVDGAQEVMEYQFQDISEYPSADEIEDVNGEKWDGEGLFLANVDQDAELTSKQEKFLAHYQTMHDDDQIDDNLLLEVLHYINKSSYGDGAILIFLPGWQEISEVSILLESTPPFNNRSRFLVLPLHSGIPSADQRKVLRRPPQGVRKIMLSTNIAETSLTIDDVAFVVDSGRKCILIFDFLLTHSQTNLNLRFNLNSDNRCKRKGLRSPFEDFDASAYMD
jgi:hypothetical protein